jgi:thiosulfate/3-mercaptopyruvate sulfurtransferase
MTRASYLVDAQTLVNELDGDAPPVLLDVRFSPTGPDLRPDYEAGHIPGAHFVDLMTDLSREGGGVEGRRPLPDPGALQRTLRSWGIHDDSRVVVYDNKCGLAAGRAWWVLTWAGLAAVRLLDGGYAAWLTAGGPTSTKEPHRTGSGTITVRPGALPVLTADEAAQLPATGILLDARGTAAYEGRPVKPGEAPEGHIPGAIEASTRGSLDDQGLILSDAALRARFEELGVTGDLAVGAYCGGGVAAAHQVLTLKLVGINAALFVGSWSAWSADPARPVATGSEPGWPPPNGLANTKREIS